MSISSEGMELEGMERLLSSHEQDASVLMVDGVPYTLEGCVQCFLLSV